MKRSRTLTLTSLMAAGGVSLTACGDGPGDAVRIGAADPGTEAFAYQTLEACKAAGEVPVAACETAQTAALADDAKSARWNDQASCEDVYGEGQCVPRSQAGGGSIWGPLITGFVVGRMLDGGWGGRGLYRDWRDGGFYTASGGRVWTDYATGRTRVGRRGFDPPDIVRPPERVQSRTGVISRGGFGGRMSARSSGSRWGG